MLHFGFDISLPFCILFGCAILLVIPYVFVYLRPVWRITNSVRKAAMRNPDFSAPAVPVSVIVFASDQADSLRRLLPSILGQRYNGPFEVIVVNDGESDRTSEVVERLRLLHDNLYLTFTPDGAQQLSRKKLALMIGIKAARYPVTVHTTAAAEIDSDNWLTLMTTPFTDNAHTEVVLGYSYLTAENAGNGKSAHRAFSQTADAVPWLFGALKGKPYRGTEMNLAYTRDIFFKNRGFSRSLNLKYGDDDIFVNEIARGDNTAVVLHPESIVRRDARNPAAKYRELTDRYYFSGSRIPKGARRRQASGAILLWIITALCVAGAVVTYPNLLGLAVAAFIILSLLIGTAVIWRRNIQALTGRKMLFSLPALVLWRPVSKSAGRVSAWLNRKYNYTWN